MKPRRVETNIFQTENGNYLVDIYLTNQFNGKRQRIRKTCRNLSEARQIRHEQRALNDLRRWDCKPRQTVTVNQIITLALEEKVRSYHRRNPTLEKDAKPSSYADMENRLVVVGNFFGGKTPIEKINEPWIDRFTDHLRRLPNQRRNKTSLSNQSIDHHLAELRYILRLAHRQEFISRMPHIPFLRNYGEREFDLDMDTFIQVVNELPEPPKPHRALMLMALNTGQRRSDLMGMTWDQVKETHVVYRSSKTGRRGIKAPLLGVTKTALNALRPSARNEHIFINPKTGRPLTDARKSLTNACKKLGVPRFTLHHLRHLATTVLLEYTNGDRDLVKRIIGWSSMEMIDRYGHIGHRAIPAYREINQALQGRLKV